MKVVTSGFKDALIESGREFDSKIIFTISGTTTTLGPEELINTNLSYKGSILKSIMKQLEFETETNIPLETILEYRIGLKVNDAYEYISYGNFVVKKANFNDDRNSYTYTCYDKMVYSMEDYESLGVTYPITIRNYINAICTKLGLTFKNANSTFTNYDKEIPSELYLDSQGRSLFYSYRDVLDELAQVTASCICINEADDELEIRYVNNTNATLNSDYLKDTNIKRDLEIYGPINQVTLSRGGDSDKLSKNDAESITQNGLTEIKIKDNQILNGEDRQQYLNEIFTRINGLSYTLCDLSSYGILYFELLDKFSFTWTDDESNTHTINCLMLNDEIEQKYMVEEKIECNKPLTADEGYAEVSQEVKDDNRAKIEVNKVDGKVEAIVQNIGDNGEVTGASLLLAINNDTSQATIHADKISLEGLTTINNNFEIDTNGNAILNGGDINLHDNGDPFDLDQSTIFISGISSTYGDFYNYKSSMWEYMQNNAVNGTTYSNTNSALGIKIYYNDTTGVEPVYKGININLKDDITDTYVNPQIHIYADPEGDFTNIIPSGIGINGPNAGISINGKSVILENEFYYEAGDYTFNTLCAVGLVTSSTQEIIFSFPVGKSMANINSISIVSGAITIRGSAGYVENSGSSPYFSLTNTSSYTYSVNSPEEGNIRFSITKKSGTYSNVTNNTPVVVYLRNVKLRFS